MKARYAERSNPTSSTISDRVVTPKTRFSVFEAPFVVLRFQLAAGDSGRSDRVGNVRTTTHRSWFVTCEGADGRMERPVVSGKSICIDLQGIADRAVHCR
jgi:hypothetical protein